MIRISCWTAFFLILLRVSIGWHFFFEGYSKVQSEYTGKSVANEKGAFSSEAYFREAEGPAGKLMKKFIGDPDQEVYDRMPAPGSLDNSNTSPASAFPPILEKEWNSYLERFVSTYKLTDEQKKEAQAKVDQAKADFLNWAKGVGPLDPKTKEPTKVGFNVKRKAPAGQSSSDFEQLVTPIARVEELRKKSQEVRDSYEKSFSLGKDVDGVKLRTLKGDAAAMRSEILNEVEVQTTKMKDALTKLFGNRTQTYAASVDKQDETQSVFAMLVPMKENKNPLGKMWDEHIAYLKEVAGPNADHQAAIEQTITNAKIRFDRWLNDRDESNDEPLKKPVVAQWRKDYDAALASFKTATAARVQAEKDEKAAEGDAKVPVEEKKKKLEAKEKAVYEEKTREAELKAILSRMQADLKRQSEGLKTQLVAIVGEDRIKGYAPPDQSKIMGFIPKWKPIQYVDWATRWFLTVVGACILFGLFTRTSCFFAAGFLLMTILSVPSVPWLPTPPNSEGTYLFVNKNVVEMFALLALMTTRSGQWAGIDAMISYVFGRNK